MSSFQRYTPWLYIGISHEYYHRAPCPIVLKPLAESVCILQKYDILFRNEGGRYILFVEENFNVQDLLDDEAEIGFGLYPKTEEFYYISSPVVEKNTFSWTETSFSGSWRNIKLNMSYILHSHVQQVQVGISSPEKYYEYILILKYHAVTINVRLTEEREQITFREKNFEPIAGIEKALRFVSTEKIKLSDLNEDFNVQLWEVRERGERLVSDHIPVPGCDEISMISPNDTLTTYFYF